MSKLAALLLALVVAAPSTAIAVPVPLSLTLELPRVSGNRPCGGLCGLKHGDRVKARFTLANQINRPVKVSFEMSCSGLEGRLLFRPAKGGRAVPVGLQPPRACDKNVPRYVTIRGRGKVTRSFSFTVPKLRGLHHRVELQLKIRRRRIKTITLVSTPHKRIVHK
ncbi:MAG: hypothetical protein KC503_40765 [Myxococcales bacterium]|nr:hypothetical protein [Myxococcales bacterium]